MKFKQDKNAWVIATVQVSITFIKDYFHTFQGFFHTFSHLRSFSRLFEALKISKIFSKLFQDLYEPCSQRANSNEQKRRDTMAKPTSAFLSAGPSFVPSPVTATTSRLTLRLLSMIPFTNTYLSCGDERAITRRFGQISSSFCWRTCVTSSTQSRDRNAN